MATPATRPDGRDIATAPAGAGPPPPSSPAGPKAPSRPSASGPGRAGTVTLRVALPVISFVVVVAGWWAATEFLDISRVLLPPPQDVVVDLWERRERMLEQGQITMYESLIGFGLTVVGGIVVGTILARSRLADWAVTPWLVALNAVPKVAFAPMLVIWLKLDTFDGMKPRIGMVIMLCFFPIVLGTMHGLTSTPVELVELARAMDASKFQEFIKIRFPYALPQVFVGLKLAMPLAVVGAVVGEFAGGSTGLGFTIATASGFGDSSQAFAALTVVGVMGVALFYALVVLERLALPWRRATTA